MDMQGSFEAANPFDEASWSSLVDETSELELTNHIKVVNPGTGDLLEISSHNFMANIIVDGSTVGAIRAPHHAPMMVEVFGDERVLPFAEAVAQKLGSIFEPF